MYSDNLVDCAVSLTHVSAGGVTSVAWRSDSEDEAERGLCRLKGRAGGKALVIGTVQNVGAVASLVLH